MKKGIKDNKQAVSAIVTFVLLITVALIFMGNWLNVAVPEWGSEDEERHMYDVQNQLVGVRASIKSQVYSDNTEFVIANYIKLGTAGAAWKGVGKASGDLKFDPLESSVLFQNSTSNLVATKGNLNYESHNLYYTDQSLIFESGAAIKSQVETGVVIAPPEFSASRDGGVISVSMTLISLTGEKDALSGSLGVVIYTRLASREYNWYDWSSNAEDLVVNITTDHPEAWGTYFETTLPKLGFTKVPVSSPLDNDGEFKMEFYDDKFVLTIANVDRFESTVAVVDIWFG